MMVGKKQVHNLSAKTVYSDTCNYAITVWVSVFFLPVICLVYCSTQSSFISTDRKLLNRLQEGGCGSEGEYSDAREALEVVLAGYIYKRQVKVIDAFNP